MKVARLKELAASVRDAIRRTGLDLTDITVMTEAASGAYSVTPVLAAMANARHVFALARDSRYGTAVEAARDVMALAREAGVPESTEIFTEKSREIVAAADIITNSGHVRPIDAAMVRWMKPTAVIPLMYEAWELREADVDLAACMTRGIPVAGTNERHPAVDVFSFLGILAQRLLIDAGLSLEGRRIVVLCDNAYRELLIDHLVQSAAVVESVERLDDQDDAPADAHAILVAMTPRFSSVIGPREAALIARRHPGSLVAQFWGDIDREALVRYGVRFWPLEAPPPGHQGIMLASIGAEPVVRLQAGGLKVGEVMARMRMSASAGKASCNRAIDAAVASGFGQALHCARPHPAN